MKADRAIQNFLYTSDKLIKDETYTVLTNAIIEGTLDEWNIYTNISSSDITNATENEFNNMRGPGFMGDFNNQINLQRNNENLKTIGIVFFVVAGILLILIFVIDIKNKDSKLKLVNLVLGILIGACLALGVCFLVSSNSQAMIPNMGDMQFQNRPNGNMGEMNFQKGRGGMLTNK